MLNCNVVMFCWVVVIGGGLVGLFVVECLCVVGLEVDLYEVKGLFGCKFLIVGKGGFNFIYFDSWLLFDSCYCE